VGVEGGRGISQKWPLKKVKQVREVGECKKGVSWHTHRNIAHHDVLPSTVEKVLSLRVQRCANGVVRVSGGGIIGLDVGQAAATTCARHYAAETTNPSALLLHGQWVAVPWGRRG